MIADANNIGCNVIRTKGDYVVGRIGKITAFDDKKARYQVQWQNSPKTWVKSDVVEVIILGGVYGI